jgi:hypothetical protein
MIFSAFVILGIIHLFFMMRHDLKHLTVDSRHNRFMTGVATFMFITNYPGIWVMIGIFVLIAVFGYEMKRHSGDGDIEMHSWAMLGFGTLNVVWMFIYIIWVIILRLVYLLMLRNLNIEKLPGTPLYMGAFVLTAVFGYIMDLLVYGMI